MLTVISLEYIVVPSVGQVDLTLNFLVVTVDVSTVKYKVSLKVSESLQQVAY